MSSGMSPEAERAYYYQYGTWPAGSTQGSSQTPDGTWGPTGYQSNQPAPTSGTTQWGQYYGTGTQSGSGGGDGSTPWSGIFGPGGASGGSSIFDPSAQLNPNTSTDPYIQAAIDRLKGAATGQALPFGEDTIKNLTSQATGMNAAAETSNAEDLRARAGAGGGSLNDPSTQAALAALKSRRQGANVTSAQTIATQAGQANYNAQNQAAETLGGIRIRQASVDPNYNGPAIRGAGSSSSTASGSTTGSTGGAVAGGTGTGTSTPIIGPYGNAAPYVNGGWGAQTPQASYGRLPQNGSAYPGQTGSWYY